MGVTKCKQYQLFDVCISSELSMDVVKSNMAKCVEIACDDGW